MSHRLLAKAVFTSRDESLRGVDMELRQLRYFVAVVDEGGFGRAAERLHIVPSAVSQQISRLEREWDVLLFERTTRRVRLSAAGERMLPEARAVLAAAESAARVAAAVRTGDEGLLRLGTVHTPGGRLDRLIGRLADQNHAIRVELRSMPVADRLNAVRSGGLDAALVRAAAYASGLTMVPVWTDPLYVALPEHHPLADESLLRLEMLGDLPLRLAPREDNAPFHDLVTHACRAAEALPPSGPAFTGLQETLTSIATSPAPSWTVFYEVWGLPRTPRVAVRPLAEPAITTYLATRPGPPAPGLRHLLRALS
ncbi:LysR family transcriptional regulator [Streptomyces flaveolus]|uniref:LysR family transcriptional regulator n=1 Tax=Streptomyces flaveolus TaxID=67297 RepID=UPI00340FF11C